jgi:hypothetical protein
VHRLRCDSLDKTCREMSFCNPAQRHHRTPEQYMTLDSPSGIPGHPQLHGGWFVVAGSLGFIALLWNFHFQDWELRFGGPVSLATTAVLSTLFWILFRNRDRLTGVVALFSSLVALAALLPTATGRAAQPFKVPPITAAPHVPVAQPTKSVVKPAAPAPALAGSPNLPSQNRAPVEPAQPTISGSRQTNTVRTDPRSRRTEPSRAYEPVWEPERRYQSPVYVPPPAATVDRWSEAGQTALTRAHVHAKNGRFDAAVMAAKEGLATVDLYWYDAGAAVLARRLRECMTAASQHRSQACEP